MRIPKWGRITLRSHPHRPLDWSKRGIGPPRNRGAAPPPPTSTFMNWKIATHEPWANWGWAVVTFWTHGSFKFCQYFIRINFTIPKAPHPGSNSPQLAFGVSDPPKLGPCTQFTYHDELFWNCEPRRKINLFSPFLPWLFCCPLWIANVFGGFRTPPPLNTLSLPRQKLTQD